MRMVELGAEMFVGEAEKAKSWESGEDVESWFWPW